MNQKNRVLQTYGLWLIDSICILAAYQIATYIRFSVAQDWGKALVSNRITYPVTVYASRIIYAILTVPEVTSVADLTINGASGDLALTETAALQQIPVLGEVTLNV